MNERGYIFPVTMMISFLLLLSLSIQFHLYKTEKMFIYEQERMMQLEALIQTAIFEFSETVSSIEDERLTFTFSYEPGHVTMEIVERNEQFAELSVIATLKTGHRRMAGFLYHLETGSIQNYWEVSKYA